MRFRKKPVEIEAEQLHWGNWSAVCELADVGELKDGKPQGCYINEDGEATDDFPGDPPEGHVKIGLHIPTLEGLMLATEGDFIIKGVQGELYPCKPDIFLASYEGADTDAEEYLSVARRQMEAAQTGSLMDAPPPGGDVFP